MWFAEIFLDASKQWSCKRVCGGFGWLSVIGMLWYCTIHSINPPIILEAFMWACTSLIGLDSITSIWKGGNNGKPDKN